jgi:hypothetical protein
MTLRKKFYLSILIFLIILPDYFYSLLGDVRKDNESLIKNYEIFCANTKSTIQTNLDDLFQLQANIDALTTTLKEKDGWVLKVTSLIRPRMGRLFFSAFKCMTDWTLEMYAKYMFVCFN